MSNLFSSFQDFDKDDLEEKIWQEMYDAKKSKDKGDGDKDNRNDKYLKKTTNVKKGATFRHSIYGIIISGSKKGNEVEIRYFLPSKFEVEVGSNVEIRSVKKLNIGDVVNNCVILSKTGDNKYLSHCKRTLFFKGNDIQRINNEVIILYGPFKDQRGIIKSEHKAKVGVVFMDNTPMTLDASDIFYKDLLLNNGKYFNVFSVSPFGDNDYNIRGKEFGESILKTVTLKDIKEMITGFKLQEMYKELERDENKFMYNEMSSEISSVSDDESEGYGEGDESEGDEGRPKSSFKDIQRSSIVTSTWSNKQKKYINVINNIIKKLGIDNSGMNMYSIVENLEGVLKHFDKIIKKESGNFDIYNSSIDIQIIIACIIAYDLVKTDDFDFSSMEDYINYLFSKGYFSGNITKSIFALLSNIFPCKQLKGTKSELERIIKIVDCFDNIIKKIMNIDIDIKKKSAPKYEAITRRENKYKERTFMLPSDFTDRSITEEDVNKRILWNPTYTERIDKWKSHIKSKGESSKGIKQKVYGFIEENIERSPLVLFSLRMEVIEFLKSRYPDMADLIQSCKGDKQCEEDVIKKYIKISIDSVLDKRGKSRVISNEDYEMLQRYTSMRDFTKEFISDIGKVREYTREERLKEIGSDLGSRSSRSIKSSRERMINWLLNKFKYKVDDNCEDDICKDKMIVDTLKEIISKYRNKLSDVEMHMVEDFISETKIQETPKEEQRKIPKIILRLKRPEIPLKKTSDTETEESDTETSETYSSKSSLFGDE